MSATGFIQTTPGQDAALLRSIAATDTATGAALRAEGVAPAGGGDTTDAPVNAEGAKRKPSTDPAGPTDDELAEYDRETCRQVCEAEALCRAADAEWESLKVATSEAKKRAEGKVCDLRDLIRRRQDERGAEPERTLLDFAKPVPAKWRGYDLDTIAIHRDVRKVLTEAGIKTLGELYEQVSAQWDAATGPPMGLTMNETAELRERVQAIIDAEFNATEEAGEYGAGEVIPDTLWRDYPIERWTRFGATAKDVERMAAGEVKRETGRRPIVTVGDLSDFTAPTGSGYTRKYADIKGVGGAGADRISDAELQFWAWWKAGGETEFARERGVIGASSPRHPRGDAPAGGDDRPGPMPSVGALLGFSDDGNAGPGDADPGEESFAPIDSTDTAGSFGGPGQAPGW